MHQSSIFFAFFWLITGISYLAFSGQAEGFVSVRSVLIFAIIALLIAILFNLYALFAAYIHKRHRSFKHQSILLGVKVIALACIFAGHQLDSQRITESMQRGDELVQAIEAHKATHGTYPETKEAYPSALVDKKWQHYVPALARSEFHLFIKNDTEFSVSFSSIAFMTCSRNNLSPNWICDD